MVPIIQVEHLSKAYRIGLKEQVPDTLMSAATGWIKSPFKNFRRLRRLNTFNVQEEADDILWALKDVSFEVREGDVVGIIGRNGAGKSTLLKILSRITEPTSGRAVIRGRISSLLEVGTGFHPELTGRENIYMNGTILGMTKKEIDRKFDEIVDFSGVEKFLDTPIKRYSSGMQVRLAFSVAAHLEPEILIVDEVLAVGDVEFQKKCLGKMREVASGGRTILFVSHNLGAIRSLCSRGLLLNSGIIDLDATAQETVAHYLTKLSQPNAISLSHRQDREGDGTGKIERMRFVDDLGNPVKHAVAGSALLIEIIYYIGTHCAKPEIALSCWNTDGLKLFHTDNTFYPCVSPEIGRKASVVCGIKRVTLAPGHYYFNVQLRTNGRVADHIYHAASLTVIPGAYGEISFVSAKGGIFFIESEWHSALS